MQTAFRGLLTSASAVTALVPEPRIEWARVGQGKGLPSIALHMIGHSPGLTHDGSDGFWQGRVQVDVYGATYASAKAVSDALVSLLHGHKGDGFQLIHFDSQRDNFETAAADRPCRISLDFLTIWSE